jgi:hypothetical protein
MSGVKDQENIEELRKRLYDRGAKYVKPERHKLSTQAFDVARGWSGMSRVGEASHMTNHSPEIIPPQEVAVPAADDSSLPISSESVKTEEALIIETTHNKPTRRYRVIILLFSLLFFIVTALASSVFLMIGNNQISAQNINLTLSTPFSLAGGEVLELNVGLTNQNTVALESATLIINYPAGTRSADGENRDLFEERIPITDLQPRKAINIPLRAVIFGEENEEKEIKAALEYRVQGSNGNFFKEAAPQRVRITSSPLVVQVLSVDRISSGQEMEVKIVLRSNANASQRNLLVTTSYPDSFSFTSAEPAPDFSQTGWIISELKPEETKEIIVRGRVVGLSEESGEVQVRIGNPRTENQFVIGSLLSQARTSYVIERPFMDITIAINNDSDGEAVIESGQETDVRVLIKNSLAESVYDVRLEVKPEGNLIRDDKLVFNQGIFDRSAGVIRLDVAGDRSLERLNSNETREFNFKVLPDPGQETASFRVSVNVFARRVNEARAAEVLVGSVSAEAKYSSRIAIARQLGYDDGPFSDTGPVPPVVETPTTYTVTLVASAGVNDMTGGVVTFNLPQYIDWTNQVSGDGSIEFNPVAKQARWLVGDVKARERKQTRFQIRLTPTSSQVGRPVIVLGEQELRATDRFTGVSLRAVAPVLESEMSSELGFVNNNGIVQPRAQ